MLKKLKWPLIGMGAALVVLVVIAAVQGANYQVSREITINAPAEKIFPYINNPRKMHEWSPWVELDPKAAMIHSGPDEGPGARTSWSGGEKLGEGSATIMESVPNQKVVTKLRFVEPRPMDQVSEINIRPEGAGSVVTWSVMGENGLMGRIVCLFMNMDKMVGGIFEKGLVNLKRKVEGA